MSPTEPDRRQEEQEKVLAEIKARDDEAGAVPIN